MVRDALEEARQQVASSSVRTPPGGLHLGCDRGDQRRRVGRHPPAPGCPGPLCRRRALRRARGVGPAGARPRRIPVDGTARIDAGALPARLRSTSLPRARSGALPVGQSRSGDTAAGGRHRRACAGRRGPGARRCRSRVRARPTGPRRPRGGPRQPERAQDGRPPRGRRAGDPPREPVRTPPRGRGTGAGAAGRARGAAGPHGLRRRRGTALDEQRLLHEEARRPRAQIAALATWPLGPRRRRRGPPPPDSACPTWCAWACTGSKPSRC